MLCLLFAVFTAIWSYEEGAIAVSTLLLQMREAKHSEVLEFHQDRTASRWQKLTLDSVL